MRLVLLFLLPALYGQDLRSLAKTCVPEADYLSLRAIALTESGGNFWALSINRPARSARDRGFPGRFFLDQQPRSREQALRWARKLLADRYTLSVGILQVNTEHGYDLEALLDPCRNLRIGWQLFVQAYRRSRSISLALSLYNSGSTRVGISNGYAGNVISHAK